MEEIIPLEVIIMHGLNMADALSSVCNDKAKRIYEHALMLYHFVGNDSRIEERKEEVKENLRRYAHAK